MELLALVARLRLGCCCTDSASESHVIVDPCEDVPASGPSPYLDWEAELATLRDVESCEEYQTCEFTVTVFKDARHIPADHTALIDALRHKATSSLHPATSQRLCIWCRPIPPPWCRDRLFSVVDGRGHSMYVFCFWVSRCWRWNR